MTKRHRRYLGGLMSPRRPQRFHAVPEDYGKTRLDLSWGELEPDAYRGVIGWSRVAGDQVSKSEILQATLIYMTNPDHGYAVSVSITGESDQKWDVLGFCRDYNRWVKNYNERKDHTRNNVAPLQPITQSQAETVALAAEGWNQQAIAAWLGVNQATVSRRLSRGRAKLAGWLPLEVVYKLAAA